MTKTTLYYREGASDKVYQASIETTGEGCIVKFAYGRRGTTLTTGVKTHHPVDLGKATEIYEKLIRAKLSKGYTVGESGISQVTSKGEGEDSGIRCQLLNSITQEEASRLLMDDDWCLQQKFDGRRMMIRKTGDNVVGISRRGLIVSVPEPIELAALEIPCDFLIDGESVGEVLHAFDLLELNSSDLRANSYLDRLAAMIRWIEMGETIRFVLTPVTAEGKRSLYDQLDAENAEGVVFKNLKLPFTGGRPASGGSQLKHKFVETASFIVNSIHPKKRSIGVALLNPEGKLVSAGNVTIPVNQDLPRPGSVVEVRYLYAFRESGSIYQPLYLGCRQDVDYNECLITQIKFKPSVADAA